MFAAIEHKHKDTNDIININYRKVNDDIDVSVVFSPGKQNKLIEVINGEILLRMTCSTIREYINDLFDIEDIDNIPVPKYTVSVRNGSVLIFDSEVEYIKMIFSHDKDIDETMIPYEYDRVIEYLKSH